MRENVNHLYKLGNFYKIILLDNFFPKQYFAKKSTLCSNITTSLLDATSFLKNY